jgi:hypothetical protein
VRVTASYWVNAESRFLRVAVKRADPFKRLAADGDHPAPPCPGGVVLVGEVGPERLVEGVTGRRLPVDGRWWSAR